MSQDCVERFLGRLITDDDFRENARKSLSKTCIEIGIRLTEMEKTIISELYLEPYTEAGKYLDERLKRS